MRWKIGNVTVTRVVEVEMPTTADFVLPDAQPENVAKIPWLAPHFVTPDGLLLLSIHALVVESEGRKILVDTCLGNDKKRAIPDWNMRTGPFLKQLEDAGAARESVDTVVCTHLHVDHVGWNTRLENGRWVPTFPNARYVFSKEDYERYLAIDRDPEKGPATLGAFRDSILPVVEAGLAQMVSGTTALDESLSVEPAPGHTPGTLAIKFESRGEKALFCGDILHHALQVYRPEWNSFACAHAVNARASRRKALEHCAAGALLMPVHFGAPFVCRIESKGGAFVPHFAS